MARLILEADQSTSLVRDTAHEQYNGRAFGVYVLNQLVPIAFWIRKPGEVYQRSILAYGNNTRDTIGFPDFGKVEIKYKKVYTFNVRHYVQCWLPANAGSNGQPTAPFTYNLCQICGAAIQDDGGQIIQQIIGRSYRKNRYIWRPTKALQEAAGNEPVFSYQERAGRC